MKKFLTAFLLVGMLFVPGISSALDASDIAFQYWGGNDKIMEQEYEHVKSFISSHMSWNTKGEAAWKWFVNQMNESHDKYGVITITKEQLVKACVGLFNQDYSAERRGASIMGMSFTQECNFLKNNFNTMWQNGIKRRMWAHDTNKALCQKADCPVSGSDIWNFKIDDSRNETVKWGKCVTYVPGYKNDNVNEDDLSELRCDGRVKWYNNKYQEVKSEERCREVLVNSFLRSGIRGGLINMYLATGYNFDFDKRDVTCSGNDKCVVSIPVESERRGVKGYYYSACLHINLSACDDLRTDLFIGTEVTRTQELIRETPLTLLECE